MKENRIALGLMALAAALMAAGIAMGQQASVMAKAVQICLECVGIG